MAVKHLHGSHVPWAVAYPAREPGTPLSLPLLSKVGETVIQRDDTHPEYVAVFWLVSGEGKGREAVRTDGQGIVTLNLLRDRFGMGTTGVEESSINEGDIDVTKYLQGRLASGYVRVDHLEDEDGEPLGIPDDALYNGADRVAWAEWTKRVLNPARLRQLDRELRESESGRRLKPNWLPTVTGATQRKLQTARKKEAGHIASDRALLKSAKDTLAQMSADIKAALAPVVKAPAPQVLEPKASEAPVIEAPPEKTTPAPAAPTKTEGGKPAK